MCTTVTKPMTTVHASLNEEMRRRETEEWICFMFKKTSRKELSASPRFWAWASWMKTRLRCPSHGINTRRCPPHPASPTQLKQHTEPGEMRPRKDWTWAHAGKASLSGPAGDRTRKPRSGSSLQHGHKQSGASPLLRKQAGRISQALTSVTGEETSDRDDNWQMTTETKQEPASTWCEWRTEGRRVDRRGGNTSPTGPRLPLL